MRSYLCQTFTTKIFLDKRNADQTVSRKHAVHYHPKRTSVVSLLSLSPLLPQWCEWTKNNNKKRKNKPKTRKTKRGKTPSSKKQESFNRFPTMGATADGSDYKIHYGNDSVVVEDVSGGGGEPTKTAPSSSSSPQTNQSAEQKRNRCLNGLMLLLIFGTLGVVVGFAVVYLINFVDEEDVNPLGILVFIFFFVFLCCVVPKSLHSRTKQYKKQIHDPELLQNTVDIERTASLKI